MKRKTIMMITGLMTVAMLLSGCAGNDASNEYITVGGYKEVEVPDLTEPEEITEDDVDSYIESVLANNTTKEQITDREVKSGDTVNIDFVGKMNGEEFDGGSSQGWDLEIGSGSFIEGFEDSVIGHKAGDKYDWNGKFPDDYGNTEYAGKDVTFTITVNYICGADIQPELTDEFVQTVSDTAKTVEEYRKEIMDQLTNNNTTDYKTSLQENAWEAVLEKVEIKKYPEGAVEAEVEKITTYYQNAAQAYGVEFEDFLSTYYGMTEEDFNEQVQKAAEDTVKQKLMAEAIAKKENLVPTDEEYQAEYEKMAEEYGYDSAQELIDVATEEELQSIILIERVKEFLAEHAIQVKE